MKDALSIHRALLERDAHHEIVRLRRPISYADELPAVLNVPRRRCLVVHMFVADERVVAVIGYAGEAVPCAAVRSSLGARSVRPAGRDLVNRATDYTAGLVAPLLLPPSVTVLIDQRLVDAADTDHVVYAPTGDPGTAVGIRLFDLYVLSGAKPVALSSEPAGGISAGSAVSMAAGTWPAQH